MRHRRIVVALSAAVALVATACSGSASSSPTQPAGGAGQGVAVQVSPATATVATGGTTAFAAAVTGTANTAVTWTVVQTGGGSITSGGLYTAPASAGSYTVRATSVADGTVHADAAVTVTSSAPPPPAVTVSVSPSPAATNSCLSVTFTATVANTTNRAVTWSVQEGAAGGTITSAGVYTAPANAGTYHVVATSAADPTKTAISTVTVTDRIVSIAVSPATTTVSTAGSAQFSATVTTTCGTFAATAAP